MKDTFKIACGLSFVCSCNIFIACLLCARDTAERRQVCFPALLRPVFRGVGRFKQVSPGPVHYGSV